MILKKSSHLYNREVLYFTASFLIMTFKKKNIIFAYSLYGFFGCKEFSFYKELGPLSYKSILSNSRDIILNFIKYILFLFKRKVIIYIHNFSKDIAIIILDLIKSDLNIMKKIKIVSRSGLIFQIKISKYIHLRDSSNLLNFSDNNIFFFFLKKLHTVGDHYFFFFLKKNRKKSSMLLIDVLKSKARMLYYSLLRFDSFLLHNFDTSLVEGLTISSLSFIIFRKKFYKKDSVANLSNFSDFFKKIIFDSYRGGIVDVYKPYGRYLNFYDINSSYPSSMLSYMPTGFPEKIYIKGNFNLNSFFGFLTVKVRVFESYLPFLSFKENDLLNNIYPTGVFKITVFSEELKYAIKVNKIQILKFYDGVRFKKRKIFSKFINSIFKIKKNSCNKVESEICKSILNSLYGRFALKPDYNICMVLNKEMCDMLSFIFVTSIVHKFDDENIIVNINSSPFFSLKDPSILAKNNQQLKLIKRIYDFFCKKSSKSIVAPQISSAISAYSRINIDKIKRLIICNSGVVYYSDTDSVVTNFNLSTSYKMGYLKKSFNIKKAFFMAPKVYFLYLNSGFLIKKFKGVPKTNLDDFFFFIDVTDFCFSVIKNDFKNDGNLFRFNFSRISRRDVKHMKQILISSNVEPSFILKKRKKEYNLVGS